MDLTKFYEDYISRISTRSMTISLRTANLILRYLEQVNPRKIADVGSGFSSFVIAKWVNENGGTLDVFDESPEWLRKTRLFLKGYGLNANFKDYKEFSSKDYQFIFFDICGDSRVEELKKLQYTNAFIILDDAHRKEYEEELKRLGLNLIKLSTEADEYGRYCGIVKQE